MKTFQIVTLFAMIAASMAFAPNAPKVAQKVVESGFDFKKAAIAAVPAAIATPAFAMDSIVSALPTETLALEVQQGAFLAVLLGTFLPCLFLINLYTQSEARAAGRAGGQDSE
uniref:Uncharacterized protein n=1 Tax=Coccolithus braarudii TaxID=221442 RepID=A0A7S0LCE1_9EUKA|mmetsp:Transcript_31896/g.68596  ORF Transcript_31896/g.68596 Transcript_31896/m.68596 type:complete len:113 (+) Transcript_31896:32-370(+)